MVTEKVIKISELKPFGTFKELFEKIDNKISIVEKTGYSTEVARLFTIVADLGLSTWLCDIKGLKPDESKREENEMIVLLSEIYLIRLNNVAQFHVNKIEMEPVHIQLANSKFIKKHFPNVRIEA